MYIYKFIYKDSDFENLQCQWWHPNRVCVSSAYNITENVNGTAEFGVLLGFLIFAMLSGVKYIPPVRLPGPNDKYRTAWDEFAIVCKSIPDVGVELGRGSLMGEKKVESLFETILSSNYLPWSGAEIFIFNLPPLNLNRWEEDWRHL
jgi:hypothetical protein